MRRRFLQFCFLIFAVSAAVESLAQKQLLVMKRESVLLRLHPGDEIIFKLKNSKRKWRTYVNNLSDTSVVTHRDTIPFHKIDRIYFHQSAFHNRLGAALVTAGGLLFVIDQFNQVIVQGNDFSLDDGVSKVTLGAIAVGMPMILLQKKSQRINGRYRLMMVKRDSPFYVPDNRDMN